jgi:hypothetical protein
VLYGMTTRRARRAVVRMFLATGSCQPTNQMRAEQ